jgi:heptosyltransferase-2
MAGFFNPRSDLDPELSAYFAGFQQVISYLYDPDGLFETCLRKAGVKHLLTASPKVNEDAHAARQLARPLEGLALWLEDAAAKFHPSAEDQAAVDALLGPVDQPWIALHPGSGGERKNWPVTHWRELLVALPRACPGARIFLLGGESDHARLEVLRADSAVPGEFLENLPLPQLGALLSRCRLFLGHDSGISHLAAAAGAPSVLLFGPTNPDVWAPANPQVTILRAPNGELSQLAVGTVLAKVREVYAA